MKITGTVAELIEFLKTQSGQITVEINGATRAEKEVTDLVLARVTQPTGKKRGRPPGSKAKTKGKSKSNSGPRCAIFKLVGGKKAPCPNPAAHSGYCASHYAQRSNLRNSAPERVKFWVNDAKPASILFETMPRGAKPAPAPLRALTSGKGGRTDTAKQLSLEAGEEKEERAIEMMQDAEVDAPSSKPSKKSQKMADEALAKAVADLDAASKKVAPKIRKSAKS